IGKLTPCFQDRQDSRTERLRSHLEACGFQFGTGNKHHSVTGTKALFDALVSGGNGQWAPLDRRPAGQVAVAVGGHHATLLLTGEGCGGGLRTERGAGAGRDMLGELARLIGVGGLEAPKPAGGDQSVWMVLAGITAVADWVGSNEGCFPHRGNAAFADRPFS